MCSANKDKSELDARDMMEKDIEKKQARMMRTRHTKDRGKWFGLGMMGAVGWSVVVPTLLGVVLGIWIDAHWSSSISWTLMLLIGGLLLGCLNAWYWIDHQQKTIERGKENRDVE